MRTLTGSNKTQTLDMAWDELVSWLTTDHLHEGDKNQLPGWSPAVFENGTRGNANVRHISVAVLDLDEVTRADVDATHATLQALQLDYVWHSSYSHELTCREHNKAAAKLAASAGGLGLAECPPACANERKPKYRFVVRLSRQVAASDWLKVWAGLAQLVPRLDVNCKDGARGYFVPGHRPGTTWDAGSFAGGQPLDVDALITHANTRLATSGPAALTVVGDAPTDKAWRKLARMHVDGMSAARRVGGLAMLALVDREPFAPQGQRDTALFQMAAILADKYPHSAPALIIDLVREELLKQTEGEKWAEGDAAAELESKIERCQAGKDAPAQQEREGRLGQLGREGSYSEAEIREYVEGLGLRSAEQLKLQLLVTCRGAVYVFYEGRYYLAGTRDNAEDLCRSRLAAAVSLPGVTFQEMSKDGLKEKTWAKVLRDYGTPVEEVTDSLTAQTTRLDLLSRPTKLIVASAPRDRRRQPQYSGRVEGFLRRMAGETAVYERLADWLATAPKLERATSALYLHGAKRTGKSLLATSLAQIWGQRPTELEEVGAAFNDHVARSPVVFADESMPWEFRQDSGKLRKLITATNHALRQKYQDNRTLTGALRIVLGANNLNMLYSPGETLDQWDVAAICERVFYVDCGERTADYIPSEEIADHILYLEATRAGSVKPEGRLWVTGQDSALHRALRTRGRHRSAVCQWLLKFLENPNLVASDAKRWRVDASGLWVTPRLVHSRWEVYMAQERVLELPQLTSALFEISSKDLDSNLVQVRLEDLSAFAAQHRWGHFTNIEELTAAVTRGGGL